MNAFSIFYKNAKFTGMKSFNCISNIRMVLKWGTFFLLLIVIHHTCEINSGREMVLLKNIFKVILIASNTVKTLNGRMSTISIFF